MRLPRHIIDLTSRFRDAMVVLENTGDVTSLTGEGRFALGTDASVIRYNLDAIGVPEAPLLFFTVTVRFEKSEARSDFFSVANGDVTDGRSWAVQPEDAGHVHTLTGVVRNARDRLVLYSNFTGMGKVTFRIESLVVAPLSDAPLRIAFVIDPWIERRQPSWKWAYIRWFGNLDATLRRAGHTVDSHYVIGEGVAPFLAACPRHPDSTVAVIPSADLAALFGSTRSGVTDQRGRMRGTGASLARSRLVDLLRAALGEAPDVVIAMSDMQVLKDAAPDALHLYRDAIYCRPPFQDELTSLDPSGLYRNAGFRDLCADPAERRLSRNFVERFFPKSPAIATLLDRRSLRERGFILLPLQDSDHYNFYDECPYRDQLDLIAAVAQRFPDRAIVVTQHPDKKEISTDDMLALQAIYPCLVEFDELKDVANVSAQLLPFAAGLVAVSTGLVYQALICDIPIHLMGDHALTDLLLRPQERQPRGSIAWHLLTRVFASYHYLHDGDWLAARLCALALHRDRLIGPAALTIDLPATILASLVAGYRLGSPVVVEGE